MMNAYTQTYKAKPDVGSLILFAILMLLCIGCMASAGIAGFIGLIPWPIAGFIAIFYFFVGWKVAKYLD